MTEQEKKPLTEDEFEQVKEIASAMSDDDRGKVVSILTGQATPAPDQPQNDMPDLNEMSDQELDQYARGVYRKGKASG